MADRGRGGRVRGGGGFNNRGSGGGGGPSRGAGGGGGGYNDSGSRGGQGSSRGGFGGNSQRGGGGSFRRGGGGGGNFPSGGGGGSRFQSGGRGRGSPHGGQGGPSPHGKSSAGRPPVGYYEPSAQPLDNEVPETLVTELENTLISQNNPAQDLSRLSINQTTPLRPAFGTKGTSVEVLTNHFQVLPDLNKVVYRYSVKLDPEIEGKRLKRQIFRGILESPQISPLRPGVASDFVATIVTTTALNPSSLEFDLEDREEDEVLPSARRSSHHVKLTPDGSFRLGEIIDYVTSTNLSQASAHKDHILQLLNIIANTFPKRMSTRKTLSTATNQHFSVRGQNATSLNLGAALEAWRGYFSSVRTATSRLLINVQIKHIAMVKPIQLDHAMREFLQSNGDSFKSLENFLRRLRVDRTHLIRQQNDRSHKGPRAKAICGLASPSDGERGTRRPRVPNHGATAEEVKIWFEDSFITVKDYFRRVHRREVQDHLPVVNVGTPKKPSYLPPELCRIVPAQASQSKLSSDQTRNMIRFAVRPPHLNAKSIAEVGLREIGLDQTNDLLGQAAFGLQISQKMLSIQARVLVPPELKYHSSQRQPKRTMFGSWNMKNCTFATGANLSNWTYLWIQSRASYDPWAGDASRLWQSMASFVTVLKNSGMTVRPPTQGAQINIDGSDGDEANVLRALQGLSNEDRNLQFILVILPNTSSALYNAVKRCTDTSLGISSSCVSAEKFAKNEAQTFANIALKVNLKLGGTNHTIHGNQGLGFISSEGTTMVVGIDVTHPSPGSSPDAPSVAAMVASVDATLSQFPAIIRVQRRRQEMVDDLEEMLKSRLDLWAKKHNGKYPEKILVYRDGVSSGQYDSVLEHEYAPLRRVCETGYKAKKQPTPKFTILIAGKRIHTRFYPKPADPENPNSAVIDTNTGNIKHGTVVDRSITNAREWDFFMAAHSAIKGTTIPCHYFVLVDEIFRSTLPLPGMNASDTLQEITHNMCYLFGRCTRAVSYAPPAYYADLACTRARCYLSRLFSPNVSEAGSTTGSTAGDAGPANPQTPQINIHPNIQDTMFYI